MNVLNGEVCHHKEGCRLFFRSIPVLLIGMRIVILASPCSTAESRVIGHIAILDDKPMERDSHAIDMVKIFAARAAAELKRQKAEADLQSALVRVQKLERRTVPCWRSPTPIITSLRRGRALPRDLQGLEGCDYIRLCGSGALRPRGARSPHLCPEGASGRRICPLWPADRL